MPPYKVAVLGAGVIGLSTAVRIQELRPDCEVTIMSETFSPNTTSDGSGGFWYPTTMGGTDSAVVRDVATTTYRYLKQLAMSSHAGVAGVQMVSGVTYEQSDSKVDDPVKDIVDDYRRLTSLELEACPHPGYKMGFAYTAPTMDVTMYLHWLERRFIQNGGSLMGRKIQSLTQLVGEWDAVVNCCGLGAAELVGDSEMYPVRGQVVRVDAPWIKHYTVFVPKDGYETYILPGVRYVVVGGTFQKGDWNQQVDSGQDMDIWDQAVRHLPQLTHATKIKAWAGLRPVRTKLRLEPEVIRRGSQVLQVVHNYGHGGSGVTIHWGCAQKAARLLSHQLPDNNIGSDTSKLRVPLKHKL